MKKQAQKMAAAAATIDPNTKVTLTGVGLGFLNLWANGFNPRQAAVSIGIATLGKLAAGAVPSVK